MSDGLFHGRPMSQGSLWPLYHSSLCYSKSQLPPNHSSFQVITIATISSSANAYVSNNLACTSSPVDVASGSVHCRCRFDLARRSLHRESFLRRATSASLWCIDFLAADIFSHSSCPEPCITPASLLGPR